MPMFLRQLKHNLLMALTKFMVQFMPGASHMAFIGAGSARQLANLIVSSGVSKVLVVSDKPLRDLGVVDTAVAGLVDAGRDLAYYDGVLPDPTFDQVSEGVAVLREHGSEVVLAIGGGSSMDAAKIIAASSAS